jgi:hypothetical protein
MGAQERDRDVISQIDADLANHGLLTVPDFRAVGLDTMVSLTVTPGPEEAPPTHKPTERMHLPAPSISALCPTRKTAKRSVRHSETFSRMIIS